MLEKSGPEGSVFLQAGISYVAFTAAPRFVQRLGIVSTIKVLIKNMFSYGLLKILPLLNVSGPSVLGSWMLQIE